MLVLAVNVVNVPAAAELSPIIVPSIAPPFIFTLLIAWLLQSIGPANCEIVILSIVPPSTLSPLIWSSANVKVPSLISRIFPEPTVMSLLAIFTLSIVPLVIFTLLIVWLLQSIAPANCEIVILSIVPPSTLSPLIWSSANIKLPSLISRVFALSTVILLVVIFTLSIVPLVIFIPSITPLVIFTFVIEWLPQFIGPFNCEIVILPIVPPSTLSPLIWLSANVNKPLLTLRVFPEPTVTFPLITPLITSKLLWQWIVPDILVLPVEELTINLSVPILKSWPIFNSPLTLKSCVISTLLESIISILIVSLVSAYILPFSEDIYNIIYNII